MAGFQGADTEQLTQMASLLRERAATVRELGGRLEPLVMDEASWQGPDADKFRTRWSQEAARLFDSIGEDLTGRGTDLDRQAEQQDQASSSEGGSGAAGASAGGDSGFGGGGGGGGGWGESPLDRLKGLGDDYNKLQGAFSKGKKAWDSINLVRDGQHLMKSMMAVDPVMGLAAGGWKYGKDVAGEVFAHGKEFSGLAARAAAKLHIPTGFGTKSAFGWVDNVASKASFLTKAAPFVGKALPGIDVVAGGWQAYSGFKGGDTFKGVTGTASAVGGGLMLAGGALSATGVGAVVGGPLVAAGAIISGGAALADAGKMIVDNWPAISAGAGKAWDATTGAVSDAAGAVSDGVSSAVGAVSDGVSDAASAVSDGISDAAGGLKDALSW